MATLKLSNKRDIRNFFKILAEESVKEAKTKIFDTAKDVEDLGRQAAADKRAFKTIVEEEEVIDDEEAVEADSAVVDDEPSEPATPTAQDSASIEDVSLDAIQKKIMLMRSAPSVKDSSVEQRLSDYLKFLSKEEKVALLAFVEALSGLMTGDVPAESAPDPSDPPYNVQMNPVSNSDSEAEPSDAEDEEVEEEVEEEEVPAEEEGDVPIQVGNVQESASIEKIRNKVLELLKKS